MPVLASYHLLFLHTQINQFGMAEAKIYFEQAQIAMHILILLGTKQQEKCLINHNFLFFSFFLLIILSSSTTKARARFKAWFQIKVKSTSLLVKSNDS